MTESIDDDLSMRVTDSGKALIDQMYAEMLYTDSGRAALAFGVGWGAYHHPCRLHGTRQCSPCQIERGRLIKLHLLEQESADG
jgi:hypothetical protein